MVDSAEACVVGVEMGGAFDFVAGEDVNVALVLLVKAELAVEMLTH